MDAEKRQALIAVVEDDSDVRSALRFALEADGYDVCAFGDAAQALTSDEFDKADCMVIDFGLPGMNGVELMLALRDRSVECPAIIITGDASGRARAAAADIGAPVLEKPLVADALAEQIAAALAGGAHRRN
jgi:FixJ family two-component response regulator